MRALAANRWANVRNRSARSADRADCSGICPIISAKSLLRVDASTHASDSAADRASAKYRPANPPINRRNAVLISPKVSSEARSAATAAAVVFFTWRIVYQKPRTPTSKPKAPM